MKGNTICLIFADKETADYIRLICSRKSTTIEDYIVDNLEWDDKPECLVSGDVLEPAHDMCYECEYSDTCPDSKSDAK